MRVVGIVGLALIAGVFIGANQQADTSKAPAQAKVNVMTLLQTELAREFTPGREVIVDLVEIPPGASLERHWHPGEEFQYYMEGDASVEIEGQPVITGKAGTVGHVPYKKWHRAVAGPKGAKVLVFRVHTHGEPVRSIEEKSEPRDAVVEPADGSHDFDFEIGTWKTHVRRLVRPLTGSTTWVEMNGVTTVRKVWGGKANLVELVADGPSGRFEGLSLRLYDPETRKWSLNFASSGSGTMAQPTIGEFKNGRGEFYNHEQLDGRTILVRFVISEITPTSCKFEQAFSTDEGKTWEVNWVATDTRISE